MSQTSGLSRPVIPSAATLGKVAVLFGGGFGFGGFVGGAGFD